MSPERRLSARQVVRYLQGTKHVAFATVNERGEPRVAPLDGVFVRGRFTVSTGERAARLRHLRANAACSAVHMDGDVVGITVNGRATILEEGDAGVDEMAVWSESYGSSPHETEDDAFYIFVGELTFVSTTRSSSPAREHSSSFWPASSTHSRIAETRSSASSTCTRRLASTGASKRPSS